MNDEEPPKETTRWLPFLKFDYERNIFTWQELIDWAKVLWKIFEKDHFGDDE
jgi:hypothetical protein